MLSIVVIAFLAIQGLAVLLFVGSCIAAARTDRTAVRPYIPQPIQYRAVEARNIRDRISIGSPRTA